MGYSINDFKNSILAGVRPNLFSVSIPNITELTSLNVFGASPRDLTLLCKSAAIPSSTQGVAEVPFRGRVLKLPGDRTYDSWTATFYNDSRFSIRSVFEGWINLINKGDGNVGQISPQQIFKDITVRQLNKVGSSRTGVNADFLDLTKTTDQLFPNEVEGDAANTLREYTLFGAFPTSVSQITLGFDQNDQVEEFDVEFQYQYFSITTPGKADISIY